MVKVTWSHAWRMHAIWNPKPCQESQYISFFFKIWIWNCIQTHFTGKQQPSINDTTLLTDDVDKEQVDAFDDISKYERKSQESDVGEDEKATDVSANSSSSVSYTNKVSKDDTFWKFQIPNVEVIFTPSIFLESLQRFKSISTAFFLTCQTLWL